MQSWGYGEMAMGLQGRNCGLDVGCLLFILEYGCCEPLGDLVEFGVDLVGFSHVVGYLHGLGVCGILYGRVKDSMYIT